MNEEKDFESIFDVLKKRAVKFVVIGGLAGIAHGSAVLTEDADICYARDPENLKRMIAALKELKARLRDVSKNVKVKLDAQSLEAGLNFTFDTKYGPLDILGEVSGVGTYDEVVKDATVLKLMGFSVPVISLDKLISAKKAAGRTKDKIALLDLNLLKESKKINGK